MDKIFTKIVKSIESGLLIKFVTETIKNKAKEQKSGFLGILLSTIAANLFGNMLAGKGVIRGMMELFAQMKDCFGLVRIFNDASSFN